MDDMAWVKDLKLGDVVFMDTRDGLQRSTVTKVTPKQIEVGEYSRFRRDNGREIGADMWYHRTLMRDTPENAKRYAIRIARHKLNSVHWSKLSDAAILEVWELVKGHIPKEQAK